MFERITVLALLYSGASIAFYSGKSSTVLKEAEEVKPTIFTRFEYLFFFLILFF